MELKNKTTFNKLYQAACDLADRFRRGEWSNSDRSIEECEAAIKSLVAFIDDGKADCTDKRICNNRENPHATFGIALCNSWYFKYTINTNDIWVI